MLNITVLNKLSPQQLDSIRAVSPDISITMCALEQLDEHIAETDILLTWGWLDIQALYAKGARLRWIHSLSAGVESLIFPALQTDQTLLTNSKGIHSIPVSEHVLALLLAFSRGLPQAIRQQDQQIWHRMPLDELHAKTLGILGLGSIGREIAKKGKALGMQVLATKREQTQELFVDHLFPPTELLSMLPQCDYVVAALPLLPETKHMLRREHFQSMKSTACFVNIARGNILVEADLVAALENRELRCAGLDVFEHEPLPASSPFWNMKNVIITPHCAALSPYYMDRAINLFADNFARYLGGQRLFNLIDKAKGY